MGISGRTAVVLDRSAPLRRRQRALSVCLGLTQPLGFWTSWQYLEATTGHPRDDAAILEPATALLLQERSLWHEAFARQQDQARARKRAGQRSPDFDVVTANSPMRWHGDERRGAVLVLENLLATAEGHEHPSSPLARVHEAARFALRGRSNVLDFESMQFDLESSREGTMTFDPHTDREGRREASSTLFVLGQLHVLLHGPPEVGTVLNFAAH